MDTCILLVSTCLIFLAEGDSKVSQPSGFQICLVQETKSSETEQLPMFQKDKLVKETVTETLNVDKKPLLDQKSVKSAAVEKDKRQPFFNIAITFTDEGKKLLAEITRQNIGKRIAIVVDGRVYADPRIMTAITGGKAEIAGNFSEQEAKDLAEKINKAATKNENKN